MEKLIRMWTERVESIVGICRQIELPYVRSENVERTRIRRFKFEELLLEVRKQERATEMETQTTKRWAEFERV